LKLQWILLIKHEKNSYQIQNMQKKIEVFIIGVCYSVECQNAKSYRNILKLENKHSVESLALQLYTLNLSTLYREYTKHPFL